MKTWAYMLGGLILWAIHFLGVYVIASVADVAADAAHPLSRLAVGVFSLGCLGLGVWLTLDAAGRWRRTADGMAGFVSAVAATGAGVATLSILWQGLPALVGY